MRFLLSVLLLVLVVGCTCGRDNSAPQNEAPKLLSQEGPCKADETRTGFLAPVPTGGLPCAVDTQVCTGTHWAGGPLYDKCDPNGSADGRPQ